MSEGNGPIVVCVSPDMAVRERVLRQLDGVGPVVSCADLAELRVMLFAEPPADEGRGVNPPLAPVSYGDLVIDPPGHVVTWRGRPLALTRTERMLLARLVTPPVRLWSYERLFASVWGGAYLGDTAILHSAMKRLRRKLRLLTGGPRVQTVRGVGYRLVPTSDDTGG
ncbi:hypothetical protein Sar04_08070 [Salinispora arenicola]|uniref:Transcriptional regulator n=2 Tax=Salinispora arenicola TaxID=168697 RepID=A0A542XIY3_SALAC|nr:transcriptional regulator [Salinispora arenicola]GIM82605.1 hypothetical protein Sar04_08070 [Salinispora arenicola]